MKNKLLLFSLGLIALGSWSSYFLQDMDKTTWLVGTWENKTTRGSIYETWVKINDHELSGKSYAIKEMDTIVFETIRLIKEAEGMFYIPRVKNQNDNLPVRFALHSLTETEMVFENPDHDFPQKISYRQIHRDSLVAEISGLKNGQERKQTFPMTRIK